MRTRPAVAPAGLPVEDLGPAEKEPQERYLRSRRDNVLDQVEQRWLGPVKIIDDDDHGTRLGPEFEQAPQSPVRLLDGHGPAGEAQGTGDARSDLGALRSASYKFGDRCLIRPARKLPHDFRDGVVRDAFSVGEAATGDDGGTSDRTLEKGTCEPRLPIPAGPTTVASLGQRDSTTRSRASCNRRSCALRPTNGRRGAGAELRRNSSSTPSRRQASTRSGLPFKRRGESAVRRACPRSSCAVVAPTRI